MTPEIVRLLLAAGGMAGRVKPRLDDVRARDAVNFDGAAEDARRGRGASDEEVGAGLWLSLDGPERGRGDE